MAKVLCLERWISNVLILETSVVIAETIGYSMVTIRSSDSLWRIWPYFVQRKLHTLDPLIFLQEFLLKLWGEVVVIRLMPAKFKKTVDKTRVFMGNWFGADQGIIQMWLVGRGLWIEKILELFIFLMFV